MAPPLLRSPSICAPAKVAGRSFPAPSSRPADRMPMVPGAWPMHSRTGSGRAPITGAPAFSGRPSFGWRDSGTNDVVHVELVRDDQPCRVTPHNRVDLVREAN